MGWLLKNLRLIICAALVAAGLWYGVVPRLGTKAPEPANWETLDVMVADLVRAALEATNSYRGNAPLRVQLGMVYEANEFTDLARQCYEQALTMKENDARIWYRLAAVRMSLGQSEEAIAALRECVALEPAYVPARTRLAAWLLEQGLTADAERELLGAFEIDPTDRATRHGLAEFDVRRGDMESARALLEPLIAERVTDRFPNRLLATIYQALGMEDAARLTLAQWGDAKPTWPDPWDNEMNRHRTGFSAVLFTARASLDRGDAHTAIRELESLRGIFPDRATLWTNLGLAYARVNRAEEAMRSLETALKLAPNDFAVHVNLGAVHALLGDLDEALVALNRALELNPTSGKAWHDKAAILLRQHRRHEAIDALEMAHRHDPQDVAALVERGWIELDLHRSSEAATSFQRAIDTDPALGEAYLGLATARMNDGALDDARTAVERASSLIPADPRVQAASDRLQVLLNLQPK